MNPNQLYKTYQEQSENECVFCHPNPELIIVSTDHFCLMLDPFALIPGHLLITSSNHYGCFGEIPRHLQERMF